MYARRIRQKAVVELINVSKSTLNREIRHGMQVSGGSGTRIAMRTMMTKNLGNLAEVSKTRDVFHSHGSGSTTPRMMGLAMGESTSIGVNHGASKGLMAFEMSSSAGVVQRSFSMGVAQTEKEEEKHDGHLVVLGTGWAGFRMLKGLDIDKFSKVTVISPRNHFLFTPLLPGTCTGTLEFRCIAEPIRYSVDGVNFVMAECTDVDHKNQTVSCKAVIDEKEFDLEYDQLVIGVGSLPATFGIPGVEEHTHFLKELSDARSIRKHLIDNFEQASEPGISEEEKERLLHTVVVGGGPTGSEFASELHDFLRTDVEKNFPDLAKYVRVSLVNGEESILTAFGKQLSSYAVEQFTNHGIELVLGSNVKQVESEKITLHNGKELDYGLCVWSVGLEGRPFIKRLPFSKNKADRLLVNEFMEIVDEDVKNVYAIGDCAAIEHGNLPPTAQAASQEGLYLAKLLNRRAELGADKKEGFEYSHQGMLAYIGNYKGLTDLFGVEVKGFTSWVIWRGAYMTRLVSWRNKMLVPMYWFRTFVFGRDVTQF